MKKIRRRLIACSGISAEGRELKKNRKKEEARRDDRGYSLVELLLAVFIIGVIIALVVVFVKKGSVTGILSVLPIILGVTVAVILGLVIVFLTYIVVTEFHDFPFEAVLFLLPSVGLEVAVILALLKIVSPWVPLIVLGIGVAVLILGFTIVYWISLKNGDGN